jgi:hypothetical protein
MRNAHRYRHPKILWSFMGRNDDFRGVETEGSKAKPVLSMLGKYLFFL